MQKQMWFTDLQMQKNVIQMAQDGGTEHVEIIVVVRVTDEVKEENDNDSEQDTVQVKMMTQ